MAGNVLQAGTMKSYPPVIKENAMRRNPPVTPLIKGARWKQGDHFGRAAGRVIALGALKTGG